MASTSRKKSSQTRLSICFQTPTVVSICPELRSLSKSSSASCRRSSLIMRVSRLPLPYDSRFSRSRSKPQSDNAKFGQSPEAQSEVKQDDEQRSPVSTTTATHTQTGAETAGAAVESLLEEMSEEVLEDSKEIQSIPESTLIDEVIQVSKEVKSSLKSTLADSAQTEAEAEVKVEAAIKAEVKAEAAVSDDSQAIVSNTRPLKEVELKGSEEHVLNSYVSTVEKDGTDDAISINGSTDNTTINNLNNIQSAAASSAKDLSSSTSLSFDSGNMSNDNNNNNNNNNNGNNNGDNDDDESNSDDDSERKELIRSLKLNEQEGKKATLLELRQLDAATKLPMFGWLASRWPALRERLGANPRLSLQLGVELCVGGGTKTLAEVQGRGEKFWKEFDFYLSDMALEIFGDVVLVWLLSPVVRSSFSPIPKHFAQIGVFSSSSRLAALFVRGIQFGIAGFGASVVGHGLTQWLVSYRKTRRLNNGETINEEDEIVLAPVLKTSLVWGSFMALSSNLRYQMVNGLEQRMLEPLFGQFLPGLTAVTFALRLANCYVGSMMWLPWAKVFDLQ